MLKHDNFDIIIIFTKNKIIIFLSRIIVLPNINSCYERGNSKKDKLSLNQGVVGLPPDYLSG